MEMQITQYAALTIRKKFKFNYSPLKTLTMSLWPNNSACDLAVTPKASSNSGLAPLLSSHLAF